MFLKSRECRTMNPFIRARGSTLNLAKGRDTATFSASAATPGSLGISVACICHVAFPSGFSGRECVRKSRSRIDTPVRVTRCPEGEKQRGAVSTSRTCPAVHSRKREQACVLRQNTLVINANRKRRCEELNLSDKSN